MGTIGGGRGPTGGDGGRRRRGNRSVQQSLYEVAIVRPSALHSSQNRKPENDEGEDGREWRDALEQVGNAGAVAKQMKGR